MWAWAPEWGDVATWVASVGTVAAVSVALYQTVGQRKRESAASQEQARLDRRRQAESISAWYSGTYRREGGGSVIEGGTAINLANASQQLIYEVVIFQVFIQGTAPRTGEGWMEMTDNDVRLKAFTVLATLEPGRSSVELPFIDHPKQGRWGVEIAFTDSAGHHWLRRSTGALEELSTNAIDHYGTGRPVDYTYAKPPYVDPRPS